MRLVALAYIAAMTVVLTAIITTPGHTVRGWSWLLLVMAWMLSGLALAVGALA